MKRNDFVSRLTEAEFLEFAINAGIVSDNYVVFDVSYSDDDDDDTAVVKYKRKRSLFRSKKEEKKEVYIYYMDFAYSDVTTMVNVSGNSKLWRSFVANKIGYDYIAAYERYVSEWIDGRRRRLDELENKFKFEVEDYKVEIEKLKEQMM